jgi:hypothetical protein
MSLTSIAADKAISRISKMIDSQKLQMINGSDVSKTANEANNNVIGLMNEKTKRNINSANAKWLGLQLGNLDYGVKLEESWANLYA